MNIDAPHFYTGEVIDSNLTDTYLDANDLGNDHFLITVRPYEGKLQDVICRPADNHLKQIPLIGEHVLIFQGLNEYSNADKVRQQWYYFPAYSIQSNVNNNALPNITQIRDSDENPVDESNVKLGKSFEEKDISSMQPYEGDVILEGRWGNSIRLGSTIKEGNYSIKPDWSGDKSGDPIIVLSNSVNHKSKKFISEKIKTDSSLLYLTTTQTLPNLVLSKSLNAEGTKSNLYKESQLIGVANRITLQAKTDRVILDSPKAISLITKGQIRLGADDASSSVALGEKLQECLRKICLILQAGTVGSPYAQQMALAGDVAAVQKIVENELLSSKVKTI